MRYVYKGECAKWHLLSNTQANEIIRLNKDNTPVASLEELLDLPLKSEEKVFENVVGQDSLNRFDRPKRKKEIPGKRNPATAKRHKKMTKILGLVGNSCY